MLKPHDRTLVAELSGRHGNLFVLDETGRIRGSAVPNLSKLRENRPGQSYVAPFQRPETGARAAPRPSRFSATPEPFSLSRAIEAAYGAHEREQRDTERRRAQLQELTAKRRRLTRTLAKVEGDVERTSHAEEHRARGELLKLHLGRLKRGMREVAVTRYSERGEEEVVLKPIRARGPKENLEREFHQYRRLQAGEARARARLAEVQGELRQIEQQILAVESGRSSLGHARRVGRRELATGERRRFRSARSPRSRGNGFGLAEARRRTTR